MPVRRQIARLAAVFAVVLAARAPTARAAEYELFIDVDTEEALYELFVAQQISDETFETLRALYQRGVDLNAATRAELYTLPNLTYADVDRILAYRKEVGRIRDPADLVVSGVLSDEKLVAIAAFLVVRTPGAGVLGGLAADGQIRASTRWSSEDDRIPPLALQARMSTLDHLSLGVAATMTRNRIGDVVYDPNRDGLSAEATATRFHAPKLYALWDTDDVTAIVGTYRIGFGQRLTFDNTSQYTPNGIYPDAELFRDDALVRRCRESAGELAMSPCSGAAGDIYVTPDFRWSNALLGVAGGLDNLRLGGTRLQTYGFVSHQPHSIYQYELYDRERCADPRDDADPDCAAPDVFRREDDLLAPTSRFSFLTLPDMFAETTAGGNVTLHAARRVHFGITGYGATVDWLAEGIDLDFQEWSRRPFGGPYGAIGFDMAWGHKWADVFVEAAHSFDSMVGGGGGPALLVRGTGTWKHREIEASLRYYDTDFANPYARPIAAPDEFDGLRARDEIGARLRYTGRHQGRLDVRANADLWYQPSEDAMATLLYLRADVDASKRLRWGLWTQFQDKGLDRGGRMQCFEVPVDEDERGEPIPCAGRKFQVTGRAHYAPNATYSVSTQLQWDALDDQRYDDKFRQDLSAWVIGTVKPAEELRMRARVRYLFEDISDNGYLEQSLWTYLDFSYKLRERDTLRLRYDLFWWLDDRANTLDRVPSPEHWLWLEVQSRF